MKRLGFVLLAALFVSGTVFGQLSEENILSYFPVKTGNSWTYTNGTEKVNTTVLVQNSTNIDIPVYLFVEQVVGLYQTSTMYGIENNKIVIVVFKDGMGRYHENKRPFPIEVASSNQNWRQNEVGEYYLFNTIKSSIKYDDKYFNDCILVEKKIFTNNKLYMIEKRYYAKDIGLVYVTLHDDNQSTSIFQKLISCNFIDIKKYTAENQILQLKEDLTSTEMFFFIKLAEVGLGNIENKVNELSNDHQRAIFKALCTLAINNMSTIYDMLNAGNIRISTYLNSPVPDFFVTLHLGSKPFAAGIDKAIKVIVLSNIFNMSESKLKNSISDHKYLEGTKAAEPLLSGLYKVDSSIGTSDYNNILEPVYKEYMDLYLRHGGK